MLLREAIDKAILYQMVVRPYGSLQWQVAFRDDKKLENARLVDTLEEAVDLMPVMQKERDEQESGDKRWN